MKKPYKETLEYHIKRAEEKDYEELTVERELLKIAYREISMKDENDYCINCKHYDLEYKYCKNKESDVYQLEVDYKDKCESHERV